MVKLLGTVVGFTRLIQWATQTDSALAQLEASADVQVERLKSETVTAAELEVMICVHAQNVRDVRAHTGGLRQRLFAALHMLQAAVEGRTPDRARSDLVGD